MLHHVIIYGAKTLKRYTEGILANGFCNKSWQVTIGSLEESSYENEEKKEYDAAIYQIHGSPRAMEDDKRVMEIMQNDYRRAKTIVLLHRPDEIEQRHPLFGNILSKIGDGIAIVFLGDIYFDNPFYSAVKKKLVIPHGFFDMRSAILQRNPIVIGSHTTWGEMRSVEKALKLMTWVFALNDDFSRKIIGYLGGKPEDQLQIGHLKKLSENFASNIHIEFLDVHQYGLEAAMKEFAVGKHIVLVDSQDVKPQDFEMTFNIQMYYLGEKVRLGESSGSIHACVSIPVILEMNGSELLEDLKIIKVPYRSADDIESMDISASARSIIASIDNKNFLAMLEHNGRQTKRFDSTFIAKAYIDIFNQW